MNDAAGVRHVRHVPQFAAVSAPIQVNTSGGGLQIFLDVKNCFHQIKSRERLLLDKFSACVPYFYANFLCA